MDASPQLAACPACGTVLQGVVRYCPQCGKPLQSATSKWYYNIWFVLLMLFFVLGPFGLPLVWKSPKFSRPVKWALTVLTVAYTVWLLNVTISMTQAVMSHVEQFNQTLQF